MNRIKLIYYRVVNYFYERSFLRAIGSVYGIKRNFFESTPAFKKRIVNQMVRASGRFTQHHEDTYGMTERRVDQ